MMIHEMCKPSRKGLGRVSEGALKGLERVA